jgi:tRNA uridine 5-carboxymethylaminomethyl modification enzyme
MYSGQIKATGPRYCPSIEDKVVRFSEKERHHVFVEPEGLEHPWLYMNGISTSLPPDVQDGVVHSLPGFENARIARYGYAVEYDFVNPEQLDPTLQVRGMSGLFLAGQINGTSGYEEAAAQGLMAGINALQIIRDAEPLILRRDEAYTAVMIDDLVTVGVDEPYRMFTSRAEHRLLLGCDSVYERLTPVAARLGIVDEERLRRAESRRIRMQNARSEAQSAELNPDRATQEWMRDADIELMSQTTFARLTQRPQFDVERVIAAAEAHAVLGDLVESFRQLSEEERDGVITTSNARAAKRRSCAKMTRSRSRRRCRIRCRDFRGR